MHPIDGAWLATWCEKLLTPHSTCNDVADERIPFWEVSSEIHFLPFISLFYSEPRETEVGANCVGTNEINLPVYQGNY